MRWVFLEDRTCLESEAKIPIEDRGYLFGDGVFRTLRVEEGRIAFFNEHLKQLKNDCMALQLDCPLIEESLLYHLIHLNQAYHGIWRLKLVLSAKTREKKIAPSRLLITLQPYSLPNESLKLVTYSHGIAQALAKVKSLAYLEYLLACSYAQDLLADDALLIGEGQTLLECSKANFLWHFDGTLYFVNPFLPYYQGVMQNICLKAAVKAGFKTQACQIRLQDIPQGANLFATNALRGIKPVTQVDGQVFSQNKEFEEEIHFALNSAEFD
ncbi:putative 4-amino-4-deoxychorismate lyase [Chlamydiales bacterium STE3]|nr:putative 4-amino-4-deoxychorismate lyase [Chlamydiales bacterium STE3]